MFLTHSNFALYKCLKRKSSLFIWINWSLNLAIWIRCCNCVVRDVRSIWTLHQLVVHVIPYEYRESRRTKDTTVSAKRFYNYSFFKNVVHILDTYWVFVCFLLLQCSYNLEVRFFFTTSQVVSTERACIYCQVLSFFVELVELLFSL